MVEFRFDTVSTANFDRITGFNAVDDTIQLENLIFANLTATGALAAANFRASGTGLANGANDYVLYDTDSGALFYDADGDGTVGSRVQFATVWNPATTHPTLTAADFFVT